MDTKFSEGTGIKRVWEHYFGNMEEAERKRQTGMNIFAEPIQEALATKNFSYFLAKGVHGHMTQGYNMYPKFYLEGNITTQKTTDTELSTWVSPGRVVGVEEVAEGGEFETKGLPEEHIQIKQKKYGIATQITHEMIKFDQTDLIVQRAKGLGDAHHDYECNNIATFYNGGTANTGYDAVATFKDTGHPDTTGGSAVSTNTNDGSLSTLSSANLKTALAEIGLWHGLSGEIITVIPEILLASSSALPIAQQIIGSPAEVTTQMSSGVTNVLRGRLKIVHCPWLSAGTWYVVTNIPGFLMVWSEKLTLEREAPNTGMGFWNMVYAYRAHTMWNRDVVDWRFAYRGD